MGVVSHRRPLLTAISFLSAVVLAWAADSALASPPIVPGSNQVDFESQIRPLLADNCYKCHGPNRQEAGLRLDSHEGLLAGGDSGSVLGDGRGPGLLVEAIQRIDLEMPPDNPLRSEEVQLLARWVSQGAPWPESTASVRQHREFTEADRQFWSLRPIAKPQVPDADTGGWARGPIDQFVWRQLQAEEKKPAEQADRYAILRRLCFDLWGLPPTREQIERFVNDKSDDAYEKLVDRLLASPRYGERWAQHWLDLVRYADSDGFKRDDPRRHAWRYRDYVIRALNEDRPYDQFVTEQLAGDEIAPDDPDVIVATGYYHCGIYESNQADIWTQRLDLLNEITDVTGDVFLGMSMSCARCHDHKFDPVLQKDYYRLQAYLSPLVMQSAIEIPTPEQQTQQVAWEAATSEVRVRMNKMSQPHMQGMRKSRMQRLDRRLVEIASTDPKDLSPKNLQIAALVERQVGHEGFNIPAQMKGEEKERWRELEKELAAYDASRPKSITVANVAMDVGDRAPRTLIPGDTSEEDILPGPLSILDPQPAKIVPPESLSNSTGRRTALARWLTSEENPLTARVIANRIWQHHFGEGLVATPSNFGTTGEQARDAELLDHLATQLVEDDWSMKSLHRQIVLSSTYRQVNDGSNDTLWRFLPRRLDGEQLRDALLSLGGQLELSIGGPPVKHTSQRRSVYIERRRNSPSQLFLLFDVPERIESVARREMTTTPLQALMVMNSSYWRELNEAVAQRVAKTAGDDNRQLLEELSLLIRNRPLSERELPLYEEVFAKLLQESGDRQQTISDVTWAFVNSAEFIFVR